MSTIHEKETVAAVGEKETVAAVGIEKVAKVTKKKRVDTKATLESKKKTSQHKKSSKYEKSNCTDPSSSTSTLTSTSNSKSTKLESIRKTKKKVKHKRLLPKRAKSAYLYFSNFNRIDLRKSHPDMGFSEQSKETARRWHDMKESEKKPFVDMAQKDKERFDREKNEIPEKPTRSPNSFMAFAKDNREKVIAGNPEWNMGMVQKRLGEMWKQAPDDVKKRYNAEAKANHEEYKKKLSQFHIDFPYYQRKLDELNAAAIKSERKSKKRKKSNKNDNEPLQKKKKVQND